MSVDRDLQIVATVFVAVAIAGVLLFLATDMYFTGVTYEGNGGITDGGDESYVIDSSEVQPCEFINANREFQSWNTKKDGSGTSYEAGDSVGIGTTLYAIWG